MIGVPLKIKHGDNEEIVYMSTRRSGDVGKGICNAKRKFRKAQCNYMKALKKSGIVMALKGDALSVEDVERISKEQDEHIDAAANSKFDALQAAEVVVSKSLRVNYPQEKVDKILDTLTDEQICKCVDVLETGGQPEDFFPSPVTLEKVNGSGQKESSTPESCSKQDSPKKTSEQEG